MLTFFSGLFVKWGVKAFLGKAANGALEGAKAAGSWLKTLSPAEWLAIALGLVALWQHIQGVQARKATRECVAHSAAIQTQLDASIANEIRLRGAITAQNVAVNNLAKASSTAQAEAAKAKREAAGRAARAQAEADRLKQSASKPVAPGKECVPSKELGEAWQ